MKESTSVHFQKYLLPEIIRPTIEAIEADIDNDFKKQTFFYNYFAEEDYIKKLSCCYEAKREWLKNAYFGDNVDESSLLDMHKIAAVLCRSILAHKPFAFDVGRANNYRKKIERKLRKDETKTEAQIKNELLRWTINNYWSNYKAAVDIAICATFYDLIDKLGEMETNPDRNSFNINIPEILTDLNLNGVNTYKKGTTLIPISHENFYWSLIINLAVSDTNKRDFDYLSLATICFQLQQYTITIHEYQKLLNSNKQSYKNNTSVK